jgi:hypothetical protein
VPHQLSEEVLGEEDLFVFFLFFASHVCFEPLFTFVPLVLESTGAPGKRAAAFLKDLD